MGSGIAREIRNTWPNAYEADKQTPLGDYNKLGTYSKWNTFENDRNLTIINAYTQYHYNRYNEKKCLFEYTAFELILQKLAHAFPRWHIAFPMIGSGLAGGDPNIITNMISSFSSQLETTGGNTSLVILPNNTLPIAA
jgi:O-acetyl-ADP-ribose deacetylase (regulator of RNase III)